MSQKKDTTILVDSYEITSSIIFSFMFTISIFMLAVRISWVAIFLMVQSILFLIQSGIELRIICYSVEEKSIIKKKRLLFKSTRKQVDFDDVESVEEVGIMNKINNDTPIYIPKKFRKVLINTSNDITEKNSHIVVSKSFHDKIEKEIVINRI